MIQVESRPVFCFEFPNARPSNIELLFDQLKNEFTAVLLVTEMIRLEPVKALNDYPFIDPPGKRAPVSI